MRQLLVACLLFSGCWVRNPLTCDETHPCISAELPNCELTTHRCVANADLGNEKTCSGDNECTAASAPICNVAAQACRACSSGSSECSVLSATRGLCAPSGACVECLENADCMASGKTCDRGAGTCVECAKNEECASGLCSAGACADATTLVYVSAATCPSVGSGTLARPYCKIKVGLDNGAMMGRTVVVYGGSYAEKVSVTPMPGVSYTVKAVGVGGPVIQPGAAGPALTVDKSGGAVKIDVTLDGFTLQGATGTSDAHGVKCIGGGTVSATKLTLLRSTVQNNAQNGLNLSNCDLTADSDVVSGNAQGGILLQSSDFSLTNLLVVGNGTLDPGGSIVGGINESTPPTRKTIANVTVVGNKNSLVGGGASGIDCRGIPIFFNNVIYGNSGAASETDGCEPDHSAYNGASGTNLDTSECTSANQLFASPSTGDYHPNKTAISPCPVVLGGVGAASFMSTNAPPTDLDGKTRPAAPSMGALEAK